LQPSREADSGPQTFRARSAGQHRDARPPLDAVLAALFEDTWSAEPALSVPLDARANAGRHKKRD
jgi:hypothetical protein